MKHSLAKNRGNSQERLNKVAWMSPEWQLLLFVLAFVLIFLLVFLIYYKTPYTATALYFDDASKVMRGLMPYRDFTFEYPPLALLFFLLPRLVASTYPVFAAVFEAEVLIFGLIGLFFIYSIARRLGKSPWKLMLIYTICILAIGPIVAQQFDIFPSVMVLFSLYYFWTGHQKISWVLLALGTLTKIFPVAIAPIFIFDYIHNRQYRQLRSGILTFAAICLVGALPFIIFGQDSIWNMVSYHAQRGLQLESTYSSFLILADKLGWTHVTLVFNFGSWNVISPLANALARASTFIVLIGILVSYWFIYNQIRPGKSQFSRIGAYSILIICSVLITSKVLSPQYFIWLVPLVPLVFNRWRYAILFTFVAIGGLTYFIFPTHYLELMDLKTGIIAVLFARNVLFIIFAVMVGISLHRMKSSQ